MFLPVSRIILKSLLGVMSRFAFLFHRGSGTAGIFMDFAILGFRQNQVIQPRKYCPENRAVHNPIEQTDKTA